MVKEPQPDESPCSEKRPATSRRRASGASWFRNGGLPLLTPMSEVAGRMSIQVGAHYLEKEPGGAGVLLSGVPGVLAARVCIVGGGVAGGAAARIAMGHEAKGLFAAP